MEKKLIKWLIEVLEQIRAWCFEVKSGPISCKEASIASSWVNKWFACSLNSFCDGDYKLQVTCDIRRSWA